MTAVLAFLMSFGFSAEAQDDQNEINRIFYATRVSRDVSLSPQWLCHNGLNIFFKTRDFCRIAKIPNFDCDLNPEIAPIRSSEIIYATEKRVDSIMRFYHIDLRYQYQEVNNLTGDVLLSEQRSIPVCEGRKLYLTENVTSDRVAKNEDERIFVLSLIEQARRSSDQQFLVINSPIGNVGDKETLSPVDINQDQRQWSYDALLKTPFCSNLNKDEVWKLSGEYTGSGLQNLHPTRLQRMSAPLFVKKKLMVPNKETKKMEPRYIFTCDQTWDT